MTAVRALPKFELLARLRTYGCTHIRTLDDGTEIWKTGWGEHFTLTPEANGKYDEWQYFQLVARVIAKTMPNDWNDKKKNGEDDDKGK